MFSPVLNIIIYIKNFLLNLRRVALNVTDPLDAGVSLLLCRTHDMNRLISSCRCKDLFISPAIFYLLLSIIVTGNFWNSLIYFSIHLFMLAIFHTVFECLDNNYVHLAEFVAEVKIKLLQHFDMFNAMDADNLLFAFDYVFMFLAFILASTIVESVLNFFYYTSILKECVHIYARLKHGYNYPLATISIMTGVNYSPEYVRSMLIGINNSIISVYSSFCVYCLCVLVLLIFFLNDKIRLSRLIAVMSVFLLYLHSTKLLATFVIKNLFVRIHINVTGSMLEFLIAIAHLQFVFLFFLVLMKINSVFFYRRRRQVSADTPTENLFIGIMTNATRISYQRLTQVEKKSVKRFLSVEGVASQNNDLLTTYTYVDISDKYTSYQDIDGMVRVRNMSFCSTALNTDDNKFYCYKTVITIRTVDYRFISESNSHELCVLFCDEENSSSFLLTPAHVILSQHTEHEHYSFAHVTIIVRKLLDVALVDKLCNCTNDSIFITLRHVDRNLCNIEFDNVLLPRIDNDVSYNLICGTNINAGRLTTLPDVSNTIYYNGIINERIKRLIHKTSTYELEQNTSFTGVVGEHTMAYIFRTIHKRVARVHMGTISGTVGHFSSRGPSALNGTIGDIHEYPLLTPVDVTRAKESFKSFTKRLRTTDLNPHEELAILAYCARFIKLNCKKDLSANLPKFITDERGYKYLFNQNLLTANGSVMIDHCVYYFSPSSLFERMIASHVSRVVISYHESKVAPLVDKWCCPGTGLVCCRKGNDLLFHFSGVEGRSYESKRDIYEQWVWLPSRFLVKDCIITKRLIAKHSSQTTYSFDIVNNSADKDDTTVYNYPTEQDTYLLGRFKDKPTTTAYARAVSLDKKIFDRFMAVVKSNVEHLTGEKLRKTFYSIYRTFQFRVKIGTDDTENEHMVQSTDQFVSEMLLHYVQNKIVGDVLEENESVEQYRSNCCGIFKCSKVNSVKDDTTTGTIHYACEKQLLKFYEKKLMFGSDDMVYCLNPSDLMPTPRVITLDKAKEKFCTDVDVKTVLYDRSVFMKDFSEMNNIVQMKRERFLKAVKHMRMDDITKDLLIKRKVSHLVKNTTLHSWLIGAQFERVIIRHEPWYRFSIKKTQNSVPFEDFRETDEFDDSDSDIRILHVRCIRDYFEVRKMRYDKECTVFDIIVGVQNNGVVDTSVAGAICDDEFTHKGVLNEYVNQHCESKAYLDSITLNECTTDINNSFQGPLIFFDTKTTKSVTTYNNFIESNLLEYLTVVLKCKRYSINVDANFKMSKVTKQLVSNNGISNEYGVKYIYAYDRYFEKISRVHETNSASELQRYLYNVSFIPFVSAILIEAIMTEMCHCYDLNWESVIILQGSAGCGKTTTIRDIAKKYKSTILFTVTKENALELKDYGAKTVDSFNINYRSIGKPDLLVIDECYMVHPGYVIYTIARVGARCTILVGDKEQIPYFNRCNLTRNNYSSLNDLVDEENKILMNYTHRLPIDSTSLLQNIYGNSFFTTSNVVNSLQVKLSDQPIKLVKNCLTRGCVVLTMTQSTKDEVANEYKNAWCKVKVMTVHESQGMTFSDVILIRDTVHSVPIYELVNGKLNPWQLVALSRHKHTFLYITKKIDGLYNKITDCIRSSEHTDFAKCNTYVRENYGTRDLMSELVRKINISEITTSTTTDVSNIEPYKIIPLKRKAVSNIVYNGCYAKYIDRKIHVMKQMQNVWTTLPIITRDFDNSVLLNERLPNNYNPKFLFLDFLQGSFTNLGNSHFGTMIVALLRWLKSYPPETIFMYYKELDTVIKSVTAAQLIAQICRELSGEGGVHNNEFVVRHEFSPLSVTESNNCFKLDNTTTDSIMDFLSITAHEHKTIPISTEFLPVKYTVLYERNTGTTSVNYLSNGTDLSDCWFYALKRLFYNYATTAQQARQWLDIPLYKAPYILSLICAIASRMDVHLIRTDTPRNGRVLHVSNTFKDVPSGWKSLILKVSKMHIIRVTKYDAHNLVIFWKSDAILTNDCKTLPICKSDIYYGDKVIRHNAFKVGHFAEAIDIADCVEKKTALIDEYANYGYQNPLEFMTWRMHNMSRVPLNKPYTAAYYIDINILQLIYDVAVGPTYRLYDNFTRCESDSWFEDNINPAGVSYNSAYANKVCVDLTIKIRPKLNTTYYGPMTNTVPVILSAAIKRNLNVPVLQVLTEAKMFANAQFDAFVQNCVRSDYNFDALSYIADGGENFEQWVSTLGAGKSAVFLDVDDDLTLEVGNTYDLSLKRIPKTSGDSKYDREAPKGQIIAAIAKRFNLHFAPLFRILMTRILDSLKTCIVFGTRKDVNDMNNIANAVLTPFNDNNKYYFYELDLSAYDKSINFSMFAAFEKIMTMYGMHPDDVLLWRKIHENPITTSVTGISFARYYQTMSGDSATALSNTILNMMICQDLYKYANLSLLFGDDSLIIATQPIPDAVVLNLSNDIARRFNVEAKITCNLNCGYFCGFYLIYANEQWKFLPDPIKKIEKLGNFGYKTVDQLTPISISFADIVKHYDSLDHNLVLSDFLEVKYNMSLNPAVAINELYKLSLNPKLFELLFEDVTYDSNENFENNTVTNTFKNLYDHCRCFIKEVFVVCVVVVFLGVVYNISA
nr:TPA_asm: hypothetical protein [Stellipti virus 3]